MKKKFVICLLVIALNLLAAFLLYYFTQVHVPPGMQRVYLCISRVSNTPGASPSHTETECTYDKYGNMLTYQYTTNGSRYSDKTIRYTYDEKNRLLTSETYDKDGKLTLQLIYTYDGLKTTISGTRYSGNWQKPYNQYFIYDSQGKLLEDESTIYFYDAAGNLIKTESTTSDSYALYEYDLHGNLLTFAEFSGGQEICSAYYSYDNRNNKIEETQLEGGELKYRMTYAYDNSNNLIEEVRMTADGYRDVNTFTYDSHNRLKSETVSPNVTYVRNYDQHGNKTSTCLYEGDSMTSIVEYHYVEFLLSTEQAQKVLAQQEKMFGQLNFP